MFLLFHLRILFCTRFVRTNCWVQLWMVLGERREERSLTLRSANCNAFWLCEKMLIWIQSTFPTDFKWINTFNRNLHFFFSVPCSFACFFVFHFRDWNFLCFCHHILWNKLTFAKRSVICCLSNKTRSQRNGHEWFLFSFFSAFASVSWIFSTKPNQTEQHKRVIIVIIN